MAIDAATVRKVARLARIAEPEEKLEPLAKELSGIMAWIEQLNEVDVSNVAPLTDATHMTMAMRPDVVTDGGYPDKVLANAPERIGDFYKTLDSIVADLAATGPSADELLRALSTKLAAYRRAQTNNLYWLGRVDDDLDDPRVLTAMRTLPDIIAKTDAAAVQAAAKHWLAGAKDAYDVEALPEKAKAG